MKKVILLSTLTSIAFALSGCESLKGLVEPDHVCDDTCRPICQYEFNKTGKKTEEEWKNFKEYKPFVYKPTGNEFLDTQVQMYVKLSNQLYTEVITPYLEADQDGTITMYRKFRDTVETEMKLKNLSRKDATKLVAEKIKADNPQDYEKIIKSFNTLDNREFTNQLIKYVSSIQPELINLTVNLTMGGSQKVSYFELAWVGIQLIPEINRAIEACSFMLETLGSEDGSAEELEKFFNELNATGGETPKTTETSTPVATSTPAETSTTEKK